MFRCTCVSFLVQRNSIGSGVEIGKQDMKGSKEVNVSYLGLLGDSHNILGEVMGQYLE